MALVVDGDVVPGPPWDFVPAAVDLVCGYTREEYRGLGIPVPSPLDLAAVATRLGLDAAAHAAAGGRTWLYDFAWQGPKGLRASWTAFAATGDPGWPRFDPDGRHTHAWRA